MKIIFFRIFYYACHYCVVTILTRCGMIYYPPNCGCRFCLYFCFQFNFTEATSNRSIVMVHRITSIYLEKSQQGPFLSITSGNLKTVQANKRCRRICYVFFHRMRPLLTVLSQWLGSGHLGRNYIRSIWLCIYFPNRVDWRFLMCFVQWLITVSLVFPLSFDVQSINQV